MESTFLGTREQDVGARILKKKLGQMELTFIWLYGTVRLVDMDGTASHGVLTVRTGASAIHGLVLASVLRGTLVQRVKVLVPRTSSVQIASWSVQRPL